MKILFKQMFCVFVSALNQWHSYHSTYLAAFGQLEQMMEV